jgi:hypothetical protein
MRHAMGIAVFAGMIGVTSFGLFLTPIFYVLLRSLVAPRHDHPDIDSMPGLKPQEEASDDDLVTDTDDRLRPVQN